MIQLWCLTLRTALKSLITATQICMSMTMCRDNKIINRNTRQNKQVYMGKKEHIIYVDQKNR